MRQVGLCPQSYNEASKGERASKDHPQLRSLVKKDRERKEESGRRMSSMYRIVSLILLGGTIAYQKSGAFGCVLPVSEPASSNEGKTESSRACNIQSENIRA